MYIKSEWKKAHYDKALYKSLHDTEVVQGKHGVKITSHASVVAETVQKIPWWDHYMENRSCWKDWCRYCSEKDDEIPLDLPRFCGGGPWIKNFQPSKILRMGPQESYCDKHQAGWAIYHANVDDGMRDYIRPQENGSHYDCEYVELNNSRYGIVVSAEKAFSIQCFLLYAGRTWEEKRIIKWTDRIR